MFFQIKYSYQVVIEQSRLYQDSKQKNTYSLLQVRFLAHPSNQNASNNGHRIHKLYWQNKPYMLLLHE